MDPERENYAEPNQPPHPPIDWMREIVLPGVVALGLAGAIVAAWLLWLAWSVPRFG